VVFLGLDSVLWGVDCWFWCFLVSFYVVKIVKANFYSLFAVVHGSLICSSYD
jgi:hypothetical protein